MMVCRLGFCCELLSAWISRKQHAPIARIRSIQMHRALGRNAVLCSRNQPMPLTISWNTSPQSHLLSDSCCLSGFSLEEMQRDAEMDLIFSWHVVLLIYRYSGA